MHFVNAHLRKK